MAQSQHSGKPLSLHAVMSSEHTPQLQHYDTLDRTTSFDMCHMEQYIAVKTLYGREQAVAVILAGRPLP